MTRAVTFTAAQVAALVEQGRKEAVKVSNEMHAELLAHLERVPANAIVLPGGPLKMVRASDSYIAMESDDKSREIDMFLYHDGSCAGCWLVAEAATDQQGKEWTTRRRPMRPDDFGTLFEVRP
ncbi:hypothetical protein [Xylophilus sp. Leaf220]|uniref:hypothetical protein n=1 Tax=Xylophilus sp. Leaf220 TaxID=1735686 RepID=UPI0006FC2DD5|nr:hypothetical protein [Xylophilus sp. Leaf220]KQM68795.1 hypothetical protein ASE76_13945 [Xylophilus sp. Leaf220]